MGSLNYGNVDYKEFELLAKDIMSKLLGKQLEHFGEGKDGGIDLVDDTVNPTIIVQCKMYSTSISAINNLLGEKDKMEKLPSLQEYYIFTSVSLQPQQVSKLRNHFSKWMQSDANIIYNEKIEDFFNQRENEDVLRERTKEGIETARRNGKQIGGAGQKKPTRVTKKSMVMKERMKKICIAFGGNMNDIEAMDTLGIARNTFYKYKKELLGELVAQGMVEHA